MINECPRKVHTGEANACQPCIQQQRECAFEVRATTSEPGESEQHVPNGDPSMAAAIQTASSVSEAIGALKAELKRRQAVVDVAFAQLDVACRELEEMRGLLVDLVGVVDAEVVPSLNNRRGPKGDPVTWQGKTLSIWQWSQITGIRANTIYLRLKRGWSAERALTEREHEKSSPAKAAPAPPKDTQAAPPDPEDEDHVVQSTEEREPVDDPEPSSKEAGSEADPVRTTWRDVVKASSHEPFPVPVTVTAPVASKSSIEEFRAEVARQQNGQRAKAVKFVCDPMSDHVHRVVVDRMGDGRTVDDGTGHFHRIYRFVVSMAAGHQHGLRVPSAAEMWE